MLILNLSTFKTTKNAKKHPSAIFIKSSIVVGDIEKATLIPTFTLFSSSKSPLIPSIKAILLSVFGSSMPSIGVIILF